MENAVMIAKILWPVIGLVTLGMFISPGMYQKANTEFLKSSIWMYVGGMMATLVGILMLSQYREWTADWTVVITLFGYVSLLKGILLLVFPGVAVQLRSQLMGGKNASMLWAVVLGILTLILAYGVYMA